MALIVKTEMLSHRTDVIKMSEQNLIVFQTQSTRGPQFRNLRLRYCWSNKEKATSPWRLKHQLHAKERTSVAGHPGICQAKIQVELSSVPDFVQKNIVIITASFARILQK